VNIKKLISKIENGWVPSVAFIDWFAQPHKLIYLKKESKGFYAVNTLGQISSIDDTPWNTPDFMAIGTKSSALIAKKILTKEFNENDAKKAFGYLVDEYKEHDIQADLREELNKVPASGKSLVIFADSVFVIFLIKNAEGKFSKVYYQRGKNSGVLEKRFAPKRENLKALFDVAVDSDHYTVNLSLEEAFA
jgi:hypothetical protein